MIKRKPFRELKQRVTAADRQFVQVLYGPRQVGKTTLVQQLKNEYPYPVHYATADGIITGGSIWVNQQWELIRQFLHREAAPKALLILDELQKIDQWSEWVKREWDEDTREGLPIHVIVLGSSRLLLQQGLSESLTGRYETKYLGHWSYEEMQSAFGVSVEEYIFFGGYPGAAPLQTNIDRWKAYINEAIIASTITKDILMMTQVNKPVLLRRLFEIGIQYSGQELSFNKIIGQLQDAGNTTTLSHYLNLLEHAGLLSGLSKYAGQLVRQRASTPKFLVQNMALRSATSSHSPESLLADPAAWGRWVESAAGAHLYNLALQNGGQLYYWRERSKEVDFALQYNGQLFAFEVKSNISTSFPGLQVFYEKFHPKKSIIIGPSGIPIDLFLRMSLEDIIR